MAENVTKFQTFDGVEHDIEDSTARAELNNVYTKSEADALLANKVDSDEVYSKAVLNAILDSKADEANVYSKTATDDLLAAKADAANVYTKTEADAALALKADAADVYTKTEADAALALKADAADLDDYTSKATFIQFQNDVNVEFQNCAKLDAQNNFTNHNIIVSDFSDPSTSIGKVLEFDAVDEPYSFGLYMSKPSDPSVQGLDGNIELNGDGKVKMNSLSFEFTGVGEFKIPYADVTINGADIVNYTTNEQLVGYINNGSTKTAIYRKLYTADNVDYSGTFVIDSNLKSTDVIMFNCGGAIKINSPSNEWLSIGGFNGSQSTSVYSIQPQLVSSGFNLMYSWSSFHCTNYKIWIEYIKIS